MSTRILNSVVFATVGLVLSSAPVLIGCGAKKGDKAAIRGRTATDNKAQRQVDAGKAKVLFETPEFKASVEALQAIDIVYVDSMKKFWDQAGEENVAKKLAGRLGTHTKEAMLKFECSQNPEKIKFTSEVALKMASEGNDKSVTGYTYRASTDCTSQMTDFMQVSFDKSKAPALGIKISFNRKEMKKMFGNYLPNRDGSAECEAAISEQKVVQVICTGLGGDIPGVDIASQDKPVYFEFTRLAFRKSDEALDLTGSTYKANNENLCEKGQQREKCLVLKCKGEAECTEAAKVAREGGGAAAPAPGDTTPAPGGAAPAPGGAAPAPGGTTPAPGNDAEGVGFEDPAAPAGQPAAATRP